MRYGMNQTACMRLESIDPRTLLIRVRCGGADAFDLLGRLSSVVLVASDCDVPSIQCELAATVPESVRGTVWEIAQRNALITIIENAFPAEPSPSGGPCVVGRDEDFICIRDGGNEDHYSLFITAIPENVDRAARCAYVLAGVLGFSSDAAFEIRFSVYELVNNVVEHGLRGESQEWIQIDIEREGDGIALSISDKGTAFDPSGKSDFDLEGYIADKKRRGLGLIMTRRIADHFSYERESGVNRVILRKSVLSSRSGSRPGKETIMTSFETSEPRQCADGSHLIRLSGDLDTKGALTMERLLGNLLEKGLVRVAFDFETVTFISSAGVGILLGIVSSLREAGGEVVFTNISSQVRSVFRLLNLEDFFTIRESVEASTAAEDR
jgi:anti-anti-sigma factor